MLHEKQSDVLNLDSTGSVYFNLVMYCSYKRETLELLLSLLLTLSHTHTYTHTHTKFSVYPSNSTTIQA